MDKQRLKLQLINRIVETEDEDLLATLAKVLDLSGSPVSVRYDTHFTPSGQESTDTATQDLQNDIDEIFNP